MWNLTNRVMAVFDDAGKAQAAVEPLELAGVPAHELAALSGANGVREIDAGGAHGGAVKQVLRALQSVTTEGNHLRHYESELAHGTSSSMSRCTDDRSVTQSLQVSVATAHTSSTLMGRGPSRAWLPDEGVTCAC